MVLPLGYDFILELPRKRSGALTMSYLAPAFLDWQELVVKLQAHFEGYCCLLLMDDSEECNKVSQAIFDMWLALDEVTGRNLILIAPIPVPPDYAKNLPATHPLRMWTDLSLRNSQAYWNWSMGNASKDFLIIRNRSSEYFANQLRGIYRYPSLVALKFERESDAEGACNVYGKSFSLELTGTSEQLISIFKGIGDLASTSSDSFGVSFEAFCRMLSLHPTKGVVIPQQWRRLEDVLDQISKIKAFLSRGM
jgi:hypothetical protein